LIQSELEKNPWGQPYYLGRICRLRADVGIRVRYHGARLRPPRQAAQHPFTLAPFAEPRVEPEIVFGLAATPSPDMDEAAAVLLHRASRQSRARLEINEGNSLAKRLHQIATISACYRSLLSPV
jgi:hypothetical protein